MARERFDSLVARFPAKIQSALTIEARRRQERRAAHQPVSIDVIPTDQEITLMVHPQFKECLDTRSFDRSVFNHSVSRQWVEDPNPREDAWSPPPSRIGPSS